MAPLLAPVLEPDTPEASTLPALLWLVCASPPEPRPVTQFPVAVEPVLVPMIVPNP